MAYHFGLTYTDGSIHANGLAVTSSVFQVLGVRPILGRTLLEADDDPSAPAAAVIGAELWRRGFEQRTDVVGALLRVGGEVFTIVGVMPGGFWFPGWDHEFWVSLAHTPDPVSGSTRSLSAIGRLRDGVSRVTAESDLTRIGAALDVAGLSNEHRWWRFASVSEASRPGDTTFVLVLQAVAFAVFLLACVNVFSLVLVKASTRVRDVAMRRALGASRWACARPLVSEAVIIGVLAALASIWLTAAIGPLLLETASRPVFARLVTNRTWHTYGVAVGTGLLGALLYSIGPALQSMRQGLGSLKREAGAGVGRGSKRLRRMAVGVQVAIAVPLCATTVVLAVTLRNLAQWRPEFPVDGLVISHLSGSVFDRGTVRPPSHVILDRVQSVPGVEHAAMMRAFFPADGGVHGDGMARVLNCGCSLVTPDFPATIGLRMAEGRWFSETDLNGPPVAIVDETFARQMWGETTGVVGRQIRLAAAGGSITVVGVSVPVSFSRPVAAQVAAQPALFVIAGPDSMPEGTLYARGKQRGRLSANVRAAMLEAGADPATKVTAFDESVADALSPLTRYAQLFAAFTALAIILAAVGVYGVLATHVMANRRELAVHAALGAPPGTLVASVARDAIGLMLTGGAIGSVLALMAGRVATSMLPLVGTNLFVPPVVALFVVGVASLLAATLPAIRAGRIRPAEVLREE